MRKPVFFILMLFISVGASTQNLSKYYKSTNIENGRLYFILPFEDFASVDKKLDFVYDISFLQKSDSVIMNFSYFTAYAQQGDSMILLYDQQKKTYPIKKLFIEKDKKYWEQRYTAILKLEDLEGFYHAKAAPSIVIYSDKNSITYSIKERKWHKYAEIMKQVLQVVKLNK